MNQSTSIKTVLNDRLGPPSGAPRPSKEIAMKTTLSLLAAATVLSSAGSALAVDTQQMEAHAHDHGGHDHGGHNHSGAGHSHSTMTTASVSVSSSVIAQVDDDVVRIGVLADMNGLYSDMGGNGIVEAVKMAAADMGSQVGGKRIEVVTANHSAKPDIAATKAREWFDTQGVDMIISGPSSGTSLAIAKIAAEKKKVVMVTGGVAAQITNEECSPYTVHYLYDTELRAEMLRPLLTARAPAAVEAARAALSSGHESAYRTLLGALRHATERGRAVWLFGAPYQVKQLCALVDEAFGPSQKDDGPLS